MSNRSAIGPVFPERRRQAGRTGMNYGIAALAVAVGGNILGFVLPLALGWVRASGEAAARGVYFFPAGGIVSLMLAVMAISIGRKVLRFTGEMTEIQRERLAAVIDIERQRRYAKYGLALGIAAVALNPLLVFLIASLVSRV